MKGMKGIIKWQGLKDFSKHITPALEKKYNEMETW